ncbi:dynamin-like protein ARC5 isoform X2 [Juglans regia]|uniref:Dynamin-like protein ARC5 isoform X2 n=1 Tax=Juglans regia TaxID=51240 RepID=A0A6P9E2Q4_JUGRE|nr:dynamin-like protein ARC5 isoform X2 [Juglans regia]
METEEGSDAACIPILKPTDESELEKQWRLYEAYNELHGLAQEFQTPFEAPAVLVVGHQTDGNSALVEALMGFQFNHVGGGTKTRRPITLHMKYDPLCELPRCRLVSNSDADSDPSILIAEKMSLLEIQMFLLKKLSKKVLMKALKMLLEQVHPKTFRLLRRLTKMELLRSLWMVPNG